MSDHINRAFMVDQKDAKPQDDGFAWFPAAIAFIGGFASAILMFSEMAKAGVPW